MTRLRLSLAIGDYLHTTELARGRVSPVGVDLNVLNVPFETGVMRFTRTWEYDVSEISLANYCAIISRSDTPPVVAIPVFPSRAFRHSSIYVSERSGIRTAADLKGRTVGIPQWSQTALVYVRGYLAHEAGVPLESISWIQAGVNEAGRKESVDIKLPAGVQMTARPTGTLSAMLESGEIDALISARPPDCFLNGTTGIRRLYPDYRQVEEKYFTETGIFPIMHTIAIRRDVYEQNRWVARSLFDAFRQAKEISQQRLNNIQFSHIPTMWGSDDARRAQEMARSPDPFPYGIEENLKTLGPFLGFCAEQGVTSRRLTPDDLFVPEVRFEMKV